MKNNNLWRNILFPLCIVIAWYATSSYTFNRKADLNGDNIYYYSTASALAAGQGYADLSHFDNPDTEKDERLTSTYPPGYPVLMTPLRCLTDSIVAQKWQNEIFILISVMLLYFILLRIGLPLSLSFVAAFSCCFIPRVLHFSTMMMSESAFCLTGIMAFYFLLRASEHEEKWYGELSKPWLWLAIVSIILNYHVRTQGLALLAGVVLCLLLRKRWAAAGATVAGFVIGYLPWMLRNKLLGLTNSRYLDMVMLANPWRPEEGSLTIPEFIGRWFDTMKMLVFNALPNSVMPFADCNADKPTYTVGLYILGVIMVFLIVAGCLKLGKIRWGVLGYIAATFGLIAVFSTPSFNRYIKAVMPLLTVAELVGLWVVIMFAIRHLVKTDGAKAERIVPYFFLLLLFLSKPGLKQENQMSNEPYPLQYVHFFEMGKLIEENTPENVVVCSRKPQLLWLYSKRPSCEYKRTSDADALLKDLIVKNVDFVILDALGYSSTGLYLFPAVQKYSQFFPVVHHLDQTHTYLLRFSRKKAAEYFEAADKVVDNVSATEEVTNDKLSAAGN